MCGITTNTKTKMRATFELINGWDVCIDYINGHLYVFMLNYCVRVDADVFVCENRVEMFEKFAKWCARRSIKLDLKNAKLIKIKTVTIEV